MSERELAYVQKHAADLMNAQEKAKCEAYCDAYKQYLDASKIEREAVKEAIRLAEKKGFRPFSRGLKVSAGDKIYRNIHGKAVIFAVVGKKSLAEGANIAAAHVDAPRLDLKQLPLYEDSEIAMLKTHYYGGVRKYQWVTVPLELHGTIALKDGTSIDVKIGSDPGDPLFCITDLLPHLAADQNKKTLGEAFTGENLNILAGSWPEEGSEKERVKASVLRLIHEKYGITEADLISAELEAVPAANARDIGFDRSLIGAYGHDDRVCAFAELQAILEVENPEKTAVCILADKEEIGSVGVTGMKSYAFECFLEDMCDCQGVKLRHCLERSYCISADVTAAFDPNYPEAFEKRNNAKINYGIGVCKFTGAHGKSGANDAPAEVVAKLRRMFDDAGVIWQMCELGKVDQGGGGTVAAYMSVRNLVTIDAGVPVLSMHSPFEVVAKLDCYMTYKGIKALYASK